MWTVLNPAAVPFQVGFSLFALLATTSHILATVYVALSMAKPEMATKAADVRMCVPLYPRGWCGPTYFARMRLAYFMEPQPVFPKRRKLTAHTPNLDLHWW